MLNEANIIQFIVYCGLTVQREIFQTQNTVLLIPLYLVRQLLGRLAENTENDLEGGGGCVVFLGLSFWSHFDDFFIRKSKSTFT